ncbi:purine-nucleoside phosphorylase [Persicitalea jodogahamensis]|uniref:Purine nucleoside phosphorylase n=1 Tax=Persicitalea jodogahamensis TaxID=402147 RepID=A0A8J3G9K5_9BACT|nr:purine-nucleoside phosphorylase [Persicitalea jodogahamensis]GHB75972.1 purine nucleoside phosphorylase [Persicitalea jodogahamensis]
MTYPQIKETSNFLNDLTNKFEPEIGIILGTGLGSLVDDIEVAYEISYDEIPNFPVATVEFHSGRLFFGTLTGKRVVCMQGRFHHYEGYTMQQVAFPVRVMKLLGVHTLMVSNAAGGMNDLYKLSDLMIIKDHISLFLPQNPLTGPNLDELGDRFPDMCDPYDPALVSMALGIAREKKLSIHAGVYVSVPGPHLETRAEYRMLRMLGADAVGMSTVPEILAARQMHLRCFGLSVITDMGIPEKLEKADIAKIIAAAKKAEPNMTLIIKEMIGQL